MSKRGNSEGSLYQSGEGWRGYVWCSRPDGTRYRKYVRGTTYDEARQNWLNLRDQANHGPVSSDVPKLAEFLGTGSKRSWNLISRRKRTRSMRHSVACTSSRILVASVSITSKSKMSGNGLISLQPFASAAHKEKTRHAPGKKGAAAPSVNAAVQHFPLEAVETRVTHFALR